MLPLIQDKIDELAELCKHYDIRKLDVFGSAATGAFNVESSDLDFVVDLGDYDPNVGERFLRFADALETLFGYPVDLVTERSITNPYFRESVDASRITVYAAPDSQAAA